MVLGLADHEVATAVFVSLEAINLRELLNGHKVLAFCFDEFWCLKPPFLCRVQAFKAVLRAVADLVDTSGKVLGAFSTGTTRVEAARPKPVPK